MLKRKLNSAVRRAESSLRKLTPSRLIARLNGPRVLANSLPKSGTHLLIRTLSLFPNLSEDGKHAFQTLPMKELERKLAKCGNGRFVSGHLYPTEPVISLLKKHKFKSILILRDPRDVIISQDRFVLTTENHALHHYFQSFCDEKARIMVQIKGVPPPHCPNGEKKNLGLDIGERIRLYMPWFEQSLNYTTRFERLIGPNGGGTKKAQVIEIQNIANHLDIQLSENQISYIAERVFYKRSSTFRKGIIGSWKDHFTDKHKEAFKEVCGQELIDLGFEEDFNW